MSDPGLDEAMVLLLQAFDRLTRQAPTTLIRVEVQVGQFTRMTLEQDPPPILRDPSGS